MTYNSLLFSFIVIQRMEEGRAKVTDENFALFKKRIPFYMSFSPVTLGYSVIPNLRATPVPCHS